MAGFHEATHGLGTFFTWRMSGALRLDGQAFEDVENDRSAIAQAALLVLAGGLARGVGSFPDEGVVGLLGSPLVAVVVWLSAGALIWGIGVRRFGYPADYPELLRTIGFAATPLLFLAALVFPLGALRSWIWVGAHAWAILALVVAVREALDVPASRALVVCALAFGVTLATLFFVGFLLVAQLG